MSDPNLQIETLDGARRVRVTGRLLTSTLGQIARDVDGLQPDGGPVRLDLSQLEALDTGGAWMIATLRQRLQSRGANVPLDGLSPERAALIDTVTQALPSQEGIAELPGGLRVWVENVGKSTVEAGHSFTSLIGFLGEILARLGNTVIRPRRLRAAALFSQMQETGFNAVPIVVLMSFLIGVVLSFQGASQLRQFGAEVFVVDLIAISILRELGILLTAIIVAGRSGSAYTASIGSMMVREEIDAMRTLGLDPLEVLILPRVMALMIMLPVLGFIANIAGLTGGAIMSWIELGVSPGMFITRLQENTDVWHLAIGMIKAPFFALIIGVVACWQGMQVRGSAESVGRRTTASVVQSIFFVIAADAVFSIFFAELGL